VTQLAPASAANAQNMPRYLPGIELERQPELLNDISIVYPSAAGTQDEKVTLRILLSETGAIDDMTVMRAEPKGFFEDAAITAFASAEFSPGEVLGRPVKSQFIVEVEFLPINRGETSGKAY
jgi:periplasmic protein TonB